MHLSTRFSKSLFALCTFLALGASAAAWISGSLLLWAFLSAESTRVEEGRAARYFVMRAESAPDGLRRGFNDAMETIEARRRISE